MAGQQHWPVCDTALWGLSDADDPTQTLGNTPEAIKSAAPDPGESTGSTIVCCCARERHRLTQTTGGGSAHGESLVFSSAFRRGRPGAGVLGLRVIFPGNGPP